MTETQKRLKQTQLLLLLELRRICEKHNIHYLLFFGTLLGAVRHSGFIPWDDDIDVIMLREDYEKFSNICKTELSNDFFLQNYLSDNKCALCISRLQLTNTHIVEKAFMNTGMENGICIDIYPCDKVPVRGLGVKIYKLIIEYLNNAVYLHYGMAHASTRIKHLLSLIYTLPIILFPKKNICQIRDKAFTHYNKKNLDYILVIDGFGYCKTHIFPLEIFTNTMEIEFEGESFRIPSNYDLVLSTRYGDYMTPPPKEEQHEHHGVVSIDFGKYNDDNHTISKIIPYLRNKTHTILIKQN